MLGCKDSNPQVLPPGLYRNLPKPRKAGKLERGGDSLSGLHVITTATSYRSDHRSPLSRRKVETGVQQGLASPFPIYI